MEITERIIIDAPPEHVSTWLADPTLWERWNPKVKGVNRGRMGAMAVGETFDVNFALSDKETPGHVEVKACEPAQRLVLRHWADVRGRVRSLGVEFVLTGQGAGTRVVQTTDLSHAGLPWPIRI